MREHHGRLTEEGTQVIVIFPSNRSLLERFLDEFGPYPFQIFGDPDRTLFRSMGHKSMAKWKLLAKAGKAFIKGGKKAFLPEDEKQQKVVKESLNTQDIYIQGGSWLFSEKGEVMWSHVDESPEDHASIEELIHQVKKTVNT
ncbi:peroxiredoxin-like family protein [Bacillus sp. AK031]